MIIDIIAVTYHHDASLKCFINSIKAQTDSSWKLHIIHDGRDEFYHKIQKDLTQNGYLSEKVTLTATDQRYNDWGHSLREHGLENLVTEDYVLITNCDNYYTPVFVEEMVKCIQNNNSFFTYCSCVHNHNNNWFDPPGAYGVLKSQLKCGWMDMGTVVIKTSLAKKAGFKHREFHSDWLYFKDCLNILRHDTEVAVPHVASINKCLVVHN